MKLAIQEGVLTTAELFQWQTRNSNLAGKIIERFTGSSSPTYRQALWLPPSQRLNVKNKFVEGLFVDKAEQKTMHARKWEEVAVWSADKEWLEFMTKGPIRRHLQEALVYRNESGQNYRTGVLPTGEHLFRNIDESTIGGAARKGGTNVYFYPSVYDQFTKTIILGSDSHTKLVESSLHIAELPAKYPELITV